ncbi:MAG: MFS transporter [Steroidobacteraceae bacterium]|nr:MFS transporter [Steroidobacteraceae bacterium]
MDRPVTPAPASRSGWREAALAPFRTRIFLAVWLASLASNFGTLIQAVGASWLMTSLTPSSDMVAFVQAATALPIMLLSIPAGAIADIWDRRRLMLLAQVFMLCVAAVLTWLAFAGGITPWTLLAFTFLLGCGSALYGPAWQSSVGEQVPRGQLPAAVSLNSLGFNIARTTGPAIGGAIVAGAGAPFAFLFNTVSYLALIVVLGRWRRPLTRPALPPEGIGGAIGAGLRYVRLSPVIRVVLMRSFVFGLCGAGLWALLPLVARDLVGGGPLTYGFLLGAFGGGAVIGALASQTLRERWSTDAIVRGGSAAFGLATLATAASPWFVTTMLALIVAGGAWLLTLSTFNITTQISAPRWVVGRALAVYQVAAFGGMAIGSWASGLHAEQVGLAPTLVLTGLLMTASSALSRWLPIAPLETKALDPMRPPPGIEDHPRVPPQAGPVVTTVEYRVAAEDHAEFVRAMHDIGRIRRRDGAHRWRLLQDVDDPELWTERWQNATWLDHLRQLHRVTVADREIRERGRAFHRGASPPRVRHMLERTPDEARLEDERLVVRAVQTDPNMPGAEAPARPRDAARDP